MKKPELIATIAFIAVLSAGIALSSKQDAMLLICTVWGVILQFWLMAAVRCLWPTACVIMALAGNLSAQSSNPYNPPPLEGAYDYAASVAIMLPTVPGEPPEKLPVIAGALCVGALVGVVGWVGVKIIGAIVDLEEAIVTNNAAQPAIPGQPAMLPKQAEDWPAYYGRIRIPPYLHQGDPADPPNPPPGPSSNSVPCTGVPTSVPSVAPLPLLFEHSFDATNWVTVASGFEIGSTLVVPSTGFWRVRPLMLTIGVVGGQPTMNVPPGTLQTSTDLEHWADVAVYQAPDTLVPAQAGHFYRIKL